MQEESHGLPVAPHMVAADEVTRYKNELNFITFIVQPLWSRLVDFVPALRPCLDQLIANKDQFQARFLAQACPYSFTWVLS